MEENRALAGARRELTREVFEELGALQCEPEEILGYAGVGEEELEEWCRQTYGKPLAEILPMIRADGLIEIRRAGFDSLRRSAALIQQQYVRYLSGLTEGREQAARQAARQVFSLLRPSPEEVGGLFDE